MWGQGSEVRAEAEMGVTALWGRSRRREWRACLTESRVVPLPGGVSGAVERGEGEKGGRGPSIG